MKSHSFAKALIKVSRVPRGAKLGAELCYQKLHYYLFLPPFWDAQTAMNLRGERRAHDHNKPIYIIIVGENERCSER